MLKDCQFPSQTAECGRVDFIRLVGVGKERGSDSDLLFLSISRWISQDLKLKLKLVHGRNVQQSLLLSFMTRPTARPFLGAQVASMLWAVVFLGRRDRRFHDGANDVGTASWSADEKRREPLCHRAAYPLLHRIAGRIVYRVSCNSSSSPAQPSPGPDLSLSQRHRRRHQYHLVSFTALRCAAPALSCRGCSFAPPPGP